MTTVSTVIYLKKFSEGNTRHNRNALWFQTGQSLNKCKFCAKWALFSKPVTHTHMYDVNMEVIRGNTFPSKLIIIIITYRFLKSDSQVNHRDIRNRHTECHASQFPAKLQGSASLSIILELINQLD